MKEIRESFNTVDVNRLSLVSDEMLRLFPDTEKFGGTVDRKCMDSVELSNVCREFYKVRQQAAADVKAKLCSPIRHMEASPRTPSKIDVAMETLKSEMASLMEQDLSLMRQLLTLNETIEDLKWQRKMSLDQSSSLSSSFDLSVPFDWTPGGENEAGVVMRKVQYRSSDLSGSVRSDVRGASCLSSNRSSFDTGLQFDIDIDCRSNPNSLDSGVHEAISTESFA